MVIGPRIVMSVAVTVWLPDSIFGHPRRLPSGHLRIHSHDQGHTMPI